MSCDILSSSHVGVNTIKCKKDILVKGDHEDVSDIVEKFIKVAHGPTALENNRARENARENIRKKLALEAGREKMDGCDLQICFVNEFASDEEAAEDRAEFPVLAKEEIVKSNISKRVSQIIVPLSSVREGEAGIPQDSGMDTEPSSTFKSSVSELQSRAREDLLEARERASTRMLDIVNTRRKYHNNKILRLLGLSVESKLNRRTLSKLNVAQLQLIQNDYLSQIQSLNDELVTSLVSKDDLVMEQDAMLTDIQDISEFVSMKG